MSFMSLARIKTLREALDAENIDMLELSEIEGAFRELVDSGFPLRDEAENAMAGDQLDELEEAITPLERALYEYIDLNYGENEAMDPCYDMGEMVAFIESKFEVKEKVNA